MTISEAADALSMSTKPLYDRVSLGKISAKRVKKKNGSGRTMAVMEVSLEDVKACLAQEAEEKRRKAEAKGAKRAEMMELRTQREKELKREREGAAAVIVRGASTKSIRQLARQLGISTAEVRRIYEAEGCL